MGGATSGSFESGIDNQAISDTVAEKLPELPIEVHEELCDQVQPILASMVSAAAATIQSSLQSKQKAQFEKTEKFVQERYETLAFGSHALVATVLNDTHLYQHLLREVITEPLHQMLALRLEEATGTTVEVTAANRKQCLDKLIAKEGAGNLDSLSKLLVVLTKGKDAKDSKEFKQTKEP